MYDKLPNKKSLIIFGVLVFLYLYISLASPALSFPTGSIFVVNEGAGLLKLSNTLKEEGVISSSFWFRLVSTALGGERAMRAGDYYLPHAQGTLAIAWRIMHGDHQIETVKLTIPEGFTVKKISALFDERFLLFSHETFESTAPQGYLFPDTYFFPVSATASSTIKLMQDNFNRKISSIANEVASSTLSLKDIVVMASLIEGEAQTNEDRRIVSGILWKRLKLGMPLQVDSETGTYESVGLPKSPINNPGLVSIKAALNPETTSYLYFLTGNDGKMYYSKTFDEHVVKKQKYIKRS